MSDPSRPGAVLFDVEGVLVHPDPDALDRGFASLWPGLTLDAVDAARASGALYPAWERYSIGALDGPAYWRIVLESLGRPVDDARLDALAAVLRTAWWARPDPAMFALVAELRASEPGLRLGILSNSCADHDDALAGFADRFDAVCFSHRVGRRKPDRDAYLGAAEALGVAPEAVLFIDDKGRNTVAAEAAGLHAVRFTGIDALRRALAARGLLAGERAA